jgi:spore germination protein GerM
VRRPPFRPGLLLAVGLILAGACSVPVDSGPKTLRAAGIPADLREETSSTTTTILSTGESEEVTVYYILNDRLSPVKRRVTPPVTLEKVLQKLFAGPPTTAEQVNGLRTAISPDTTVLGAPVEDRIAPGNGA